MGFGFRGDYFCEGFKCLLDGDVSSAGDGVDIPRLQSIGKELEGFLWGHVMQV
jgi:hypothetical protein